MPENMRPNMRVVSGIQPTGNLHLGNYFGAIRGRCSNAGRPLGRISKFDFRFRLFRKQRVEPVTY